MAKETGGVQIELFDLLPTSPETNSIVACIFGTTRSAFSMRGEAMLAEPFVLGRARVCLMCSWRSAAMSWPFRRTPRSSIDTMVVVADGTDAIGDLLAWLGQALVCTTGCFERLCGLLQAHGRLWGAAWTALFGLVVRAVQMRLDLRELLPCVV